VKYTGTCPPRESIRPSSRCRLRVALRVSASCSLHSRSMQSLWFSEAAMRALHSSCNESLRSCSLCVDEPGCSNSQARTQRSRKTVRSRAYLFDFAHTSARLIKIAMYLSKLRAVRLILCLHRPRCSRTSSSSALYRVRQYKAVSLEPNDSFSLLMSSSVSLLARFRFLRYQRVTHRACSSKSDSVASVRAVLGNTSTIASDSSERESTASWSSGAAGAHAQASLGGTERIDLSCFSLRIRSRNCVGVSMRVLAETNMSHEAVLTST
jgi:hypothetical protein